MLRFLAPFFILVSLIVFPLKNPSHASDSNISGSIRITADKPAIIRLEENASSIIVGNPAHATVSLDNEKTLIINPLRPGATSLVVLDQAGDVILQKQLIVNAPATNYVRINRVCSASTRDTCRETSVFYCDGGCHEMALPALDAQNSNAPASDISAMSDNPDTSSGQYNAPMDDEGNTNLGEGYVE